MCVSLAEFRDLGACNLGFRAQGRRLYSTSG